MRPARVLAPFALCLAGLAVYHNALSGPFLFDDIGSIRDNATIRHFAAALRPPLLAGVGGRPLLNLSFAANYALGGLNPAGYHWANLILHLVAACLVYGVIRRTLHTARLRERFAADADWLALIAALLWTVHPLATAAVDWVTERAEVLMACFYLLTLYGFIRARRGWLLVSAAACWLGALSKEVIVTAPLIVLLYDRTFVAGGFAPALRSRRWYYAALGCTWLIVAALMRGSPAAHISAGFGHGISAGTYLLTSCRSVLLYLKLAFWPAPLVFYYGVGQVRDLGQGLPFVLGALALAIAAGAALWRRTAVGFVAAWILLILAPTTSFVPLIAQPTAEHRFYLSLAGVVTLVVLGAYRWLGRKAFALALLAAPLAAMTLARNADYSSAERIWRDTAQKVPGDPEVRRGYGLVLLDHPAELAQAIDELQAAARLRPGAQSYRELGWALIHMPGREEEGFEDLQRALRYDPADPLTLNAAGLVLMQAGRPAEAARMFEAALRAKPHWTLAETYLAQAHRALGSALLREPGRLDDAIAELRQAIQLEPDLTAAYTDLGWALANARGDLPGAIAAVRAGLKYHPGDPFAHNTLGLLFLHAGQFPAAAEEFRAALRAKPDFEQARRNLERTENEMGR